MRQMQFESQRIQKHQIQQILKNCSNLLTALTSCNLYRIHFQEEMYYLTQLQKIEKGISEIVEFVSELSKRKYFNNIGNNKVCEDLFSKLESTFDQFVGPLLHIFNSFNVNWLLFQCDPIQLFLLDEFNESAIVKKLGINFSDSQSNIQTRQQQEDNSMSKDITSSQEYSHLSKEETSPTSLLLSRQPQLSQKQSSISDNQKSGKRINYNNNIVKFKQKLSQEETQCTKQQLKDLISEYKKLVQDEECLSELAILIDFNSDHNPQNYQQVFNHYYLQLFDQTTSDKISYILGKIHSFQKLNLFCRLIFYNTDIMTLAGHQIIKYVNQYSWINLKDLQLKLIRSGFNNLPVPLTQSPQQKTKEKNQMFHFNQNSACSLQNLQKQSDEKLLNLQPNFLSSGIFKVGQALTLCPHQSNFFSLIPRIEKKTELKDQKSDICCQYVKQKLETQAQHEKITMETSFLKRSLSINIKNNHLEIPQFQDDFINHQKTMNLESQISMLSQTSAQTIDQEKDQLEDENNQPILFNKRELFFGRKAKNSIFRPDFCFEESEFQISRQQFRISYEDQSNSYYVQCMSQSTLTQLFVDDIGFELQVGSVFIVQDLIAFEVVAFKSAQQQNQNAQLGNSQKANQNKAGNQQVLSPKSPSHDKDNQLKNFKGFKNKMRLSYKNSQLFEDNDLQSQYFQSDQIKNQETEKNQTSDQSSSDQSLDNQAKDDLQNSVENENSSLNSSLASISSSLSQIASQQMHFNQEKRASFNQKKHSFISQIRRQNSRKSSSGFPAINIVSDNQNADSNNNSQSNTVQENLIKGGRSSIICKDLLYAEDEQNQKKQEYVQQNSISQSELAKEQKGNSEELTQDFKKSTQSQLDKQSNQSTVYQSTLMNGMNISTSRIMLQSTLNQMNQSAYSLLGPSFYELEDDNANSTEVLLHLRVLWSNIETEKEDYIFQYNNINEMDQIVIKLGSEKDNQIRVQDDNHSIKNSSHCIITYQDSCWTLQATHNDQNFYTGLAVKKIEEIESGFISKQILLEKGFKILVKGYIFQCDI